MAQVQRGHARESTSSSAPKRARQNYLPSGIPHPLATLPTDVLAVVLAFLPLKPRLGIVSLVCKRWSDAVRRGLRHLPLGVTRHPTSPLPFLPSITSLELDGSTSREFPDNLRRLAVPRLRGFRYPFLASRFTALEALQWYTLSAGEAMLAQLLRANAGSLTSLSLWSTEIESVPFMPQLRSLDLSRCNPRLVESAVTQATQLVALGISASFGAMPTSLPSAAFAQLRAFTVDYDLDLCKDIHGSLFPIPVCSQLEYLSISISYPSLINLIPNIAPYVTSLRIRTALMDGQARGEVLRQSSQFSRLTGLRCIDNGSHWPALEVEAFALPHAGRLRKFRALRLGKIISIATALESLQSNTLPTLPLAAALPRLRKLTHGLVVAQWSEIKVYLSSLLAACPVLRIMRLDFICNQLKSAGLPVLRKFLRAAERHGVERVYIDSFGGSFQEKIALEAEFCGWLHVTVTLSEPKGSLDLTADVESSDAVNSEEITDD